MNVRPRFWVAAAASVFLLAARLFPLYPLQDAATGSPAKEYALVLPRAYVLTTPFSAFADMITLGSARQDKALIVYLLLGYWAWFLLTRLRRRFVLFQGRAGRRAQRFKALLGYPIYLVVVCAFIAWAALARRPMARLASQNPDDLILDFHSHTAYSWDGRKILGAFTPQANMEWHRRAGFSAAFITDHNLVTGTREAKALSKRQWKKDGYRSLEGEEVSLHDTHIAVIGNRTLIDNKPYDKDLAGIFRFLRASPRYGGLAIMSLPEYWLHHPQDRWEKFVEAGAAGFEIVSAAPKSLDFPPELRHKVIELCRKHHLFYTGITDNHGWGNAVYVWNVMRLPGQARMSPDALEAAVLDKLKREGPDAVRVIVRTKQTPSGLPWLALDPLFEAWTYARTFTGAQTGASLAWVWASALALPAI